ncbi:fatty acid-binding protein, intestinal isoform X2 [Protopterus annectens]|uniref:fatty acid-binding protein, intestinal isoform X2 n=1 Tax=Protopterus annectens TaxID=7888 RepID=UPI001CFAA9C8|nr:fatty acid-binding protein, intestinal isoform X2 [Protopterus annectens]
MTFNGTWVADKDENYKKFLDKMEVPFLKKEAAQFDNLKLTIRQDGEKVIVLEDSRFRTVEVNFTMGIPFDYTLADGTEVAGTWNQEGDTLIGKFTRKDNGKVLETTRKIINGQLVQPSQTEN